MTTRPAQRHRVAPHYCRLVMIAASTMLFAPALAQSQTSGLRGEESVPPPPSSVHRPVETSYDVSRSTASRGPCDPDYWIVSTRCGKEQVAAGQAYDYQVYRFDGPQPGRGSSLDEMLASLEPGVPVCFMAHGSFVTWESMLVDSAWTYRWLRQAAPSQRVHIIFYTWASDDGGFIPHIRVNRLGRRASLNGFYLADLVTKVSVDHPICLIGHSHGARMVSAALHALGGGIVEGRMLACGPQQPRHIRVVLAAAAMDHHWLNPNERFERAVCQAEAILNLQNHLDLPLLIYPLRRPISGKALCISGLTGRDRKLMAEHHEKVIDYSVTDLIGLGHVWANYYQQPRIADAIRHYVYYDECR